MEIGENIVTNNLRVEPIFSLLERKYGVPLIEAEYKVDAAAAETEVAAALKVWAGLAAGESSPPAAYAFMAQRWYTTCQSPVIR